MPRYFFHTHLGADVVPDPSGAELPDPDAAWEAARGLVRAALAAPGGRARLMAAVLVVADAAGETVLEFPFSEGVDPGAPAPH